MEQLNKEMELDDLEEVHGTTILGFLLDDALVFAADTRGTAEEALNVKIGKVGPMVTAKIYGKIRHIVEGKIFWTRCGRGFNQFFRELKPKIQANDTVSTIAKKADALIHNPNPTVPRLATLILGYENGIPKIFAINRDKMKEVTSCVAIGSGRESAEYVLARFKKDMSIEETIELASDAITHASLHDPYTGGSMNIHSLTAEGQHLIKDKTILEHYVQNYERIQSLQQGGSALFLLVPGSVTNIIIEDTFSKFGELGPSPCLHFFDDKDNELKWKGKMRLHRIFYKRPQDAHSAFQRAAADWEQDMRTPKKRPYDWDFSSIKVRWIYADNVEKPLILCSASKVNLENILNHSHSPETWKKLYFD